MTAPSLATTGLNLRVDYAYTLRQSDRSNGADHLVVLEDLHVGRLHRQVGDALCRPRRKFWGLEPTKRTEADCRRCLQIAQRLDLQAPAIDRGPDRCRMFRLDLNRLVVPGGSQVKVRVCRLCGKGEDEHERNPIPTILSGRTDG